MCFHFGRYSTAVAIVKACQRLDPTCYLAMKAIIQSSYSPSKCWVDIMPFDGKSSNRAVEIVIRERRPGPKGLRKIAVLISCRLSTKEMFQYLPHVDFFDHHVRLMGLRQPAH